MSAERHAQNAAAPKKKTAALPWLILVLHKKLEKLFIAPKVRQELHETTFVAFATKGQRE